MSRLVYLDSLRGLAALVIVAFWHHRICEAPFSGLTVILLVAYLLHRAFEIPMRRRLRAALAGDTSSGRIGQ